MLTSYIPDPVDVTAGITGTGGPGTLIEPLRCPVCLAQGTEGQLRYKSRSVICAVGHSFNVARQGYLSLLTGRPAISGDDSPMIQSRQSFLDSGAYRPIRECVADLTQKYSPHAELVVDVGCGTGYYLSGVLDHVDGARGIGLDSSAAALKATSRAHERIQAASADVFRALPLADGSADVILDVFAPRNAGEFRRILRPGGSVIVTRPTGTHLVELRELVEGTVSVDPSKEERLRASMAPHLREVETVPVEYSVALEPAELRNLVAMTPSARHIESGDLNLMEDSIDVTVSVLVSVFQPA